MLCCPANVLSGPKILASDHLNFTRTITFCTEYTAQSSTKHCTLYEHFFVNQQQTNESVSIQQIYGVCVCVCAELSTFNPFYSISVHQYQSKYSLFQQQPQQKPLCLLYLFSKPTDRACARCDANAYTYLRQLNFKQANATIKKSPVECKKLSLYSFVSIFIVFPTITQ